MKYITLVLLASHLLYTADAKFSFNNVKNVIKRGDIDKLRDYIKQGLDVNMVGPSCNKSLLIWAAVSGVAEGAKVLLDNGADPDLPERRTNMTPLMYAALNNHKAVIDELMRYHADINMRDSKGRTVMSIAKDKNMNYDF